jgi:uncharacterized protein YndB with AHSA1/START domain
MPKFERDVVINAPVEKVWQGLTDPNHWSQWFPGVESVANVTGVAVGATFEWTTAGQTGQGLIEKMEPNRLLEIHTQLGNDKDSHLFVLSQAGGFLGMGANDCKVAYTLDTLMGGGIFGNFLAGGNPKDMLAVKGTTDRLKKMI